MARDQNSGLALFGVRKAGADAAAKTLPSGDAFDRGADDRHVARGNVEHAFDGGCIPGRAFACHPATQSLKHGLGIERKVGGVHRDSLWFGRDDWAMLRLRRRWAYENDRR